MLEVQRMLENARAKLHAVFSQQSGRSRQVFANRLVLASIAAAVTAAACSDSPVMPNQTFERPVPDRPRATVFPYVPGPKPGKFTVTLGAGDWAGRDSAAWPDTFPTKSRVRITVKGKLTRMYHPGIPGDWSNIAGTPYGNVDANGDYSLVNFSCYGGVLASFYHASGGNNSVNGCAQVSTNTLGTPELDSFSADGLLRGTGKVVRLPVSQPIVPAYPYCSSSGNPRPCVVVTGGSQTVTIERINTWINLTATPDSVSEGDNILFTVFTDPVTNLALNTPQSWIWVPDYVLDDSGNPTGAVPTPVVAPCTNVRVTNFKVTCTLKRYESGTMYVRADVGGGGMMEQAQTHVIVTPVHLRADVSPMFVRPGDSITIALTSDPLGKPITSAAFAGGSASVRNASCTGTTCRALLDSSGTIQISALVNGVAKNALVSAWIIGTCQADSIWTPNMPAARLCTAPCDPNIHPNCLQPMDSAQKAIFDSAMKFIRNPNDIPDSTARAQCSEMIAKLAQYRTPPKQVYIGQTITSSTNPNSPEWHLAAYVPSDSSVHLDPISWSLTAAYNSGYWEMANSTLHEMAHVLGKNHLDENGQDDRGLSVGGGPLYGGYQFYTQPYFKYLQPGSQNSCLKPRPTN